MARKRKRPAGSSVEASDPNSKRIRTKPTRTKSRSEVYHPTLRLFYRRVQTLRAFLLSNQCSVPKRRRRAIAVAGKTCDSECSRQASSSTGQDTPAASVRDLADLLDQTLVCSTETESDEQHELAQIEELTQQLSCSARTDPSQPAVSQAEVIEFAISHLFNKTVRPNTKPPHLLCHGYRKINPRNSEDADRCALTGIHGIVSQDFNENVKTLSGPLWSSVLNALGAQGPAVMLDLLLRRAIFSPMQGGRSSYFQLSGQPLSDVEPLQPSQKERKGGVQETSQAAPIVNPPQKRLAPDSGTSRGPASISFARSRILHALPALNSKGNVIFGVSRIAFLGHCKRPLKEGDTVKLLRCVFPRQFGLVNVFTAKIDPLKMQMIPELRPGAVLVEPDASKYGSRLPPRLCGSPHRLIQRLQVLHRRCHYAELLSLHCPVHDGSTAGPMLKHASSHAEVSAFCCAVVSKILPLEFWSRSGCNGSNKMMILHHVKDFVAMRKFESFTLHRLSQNLKVEEMGWLVPLKMRDSQAASQSEARKRREILLEFLYWIFDTLLVALIRANFYVTEANNTQNELFYFRHDIWRTLIRPTMTDLKENAWERVNLQDAQSILSERQLGCSEVRLLPKSDGFRLISNLRRKAVVMQHGRKALVPGINQILAPIHRILDFRRLQMPDSLGSSLFSTGDMHSKLKIFAQTLQAGTRSGPLYFAKVDVKSCFDTIPQKEAVETIARLIAGDKYKVESHCELRYPRDIQAGRRDSLSLQTAGMSGIRPTRRIRQVARLKDDSQPLGTRALSANKNAKQGTIFIANDGHQLQNTDAIIDLLHEHIEMNMVQIGQTYYRQKTGIPQGSVLSSIICNFFYADLEKQYLSFLDQKDSLLLRLIDDFLLITTNKEHAMTFLEIMHSGIPSHGVEVSPAKSLANFEFTVNGQAIAQQALDEDFPYCGNTINTRTLAIMKDRHRNKDRVLANSLTVESSKTPGQVFYRKILSAFKIQTHRMLFDMHHNPAATVLANIYQSFLETAMKCYRYVKSMIARARPSDDMMKGTIRDLIELAFVLVTGKHKQYAAREYRCTISKRQVQWLAGCAFHRILKHKQTKYRAVLAWLEEEILADATAAGVKDLKVMIEIAQQGDRIFAGYRF